LTQIRDSVADMLGVTHLQSQFSSPSVTMGRDLYIESHMFETGRAAVLKFCVLLDMDQIFQS